MFYEKITQLNQTIMDCLNETDEVKVIKAFTDLGIKILHASFGFVWLNSYASDDFELVYKSPGTPYNPLPPKKDGRNRSVLKTHEPDYVSVVKKRADKYDVSAHIKSFVIIPISSHGKTYGNIVICFKHEEHFPEEKKMLCTFIGSVVAQAITIRRLMESEKEKAKIEFLAEATHELRTPLAIIKGNVDLALMANSKNQEEIKKMLHDINYEVDHMSEIVSDLSLLLNSGASFRRKIMSHRIGIGEIIEKTVQRFEGYASKKNISIRVGKIPEAIVSGDRLYIEKMLGNVIRNAITYGKKNGSVTISSAKATTKESKENSLIHIDISDNGIGIPKKDILHIFERFYRADNAREKNHDGTGLGLAIVKFIAEVHGGTASLLHSKEGKGSTFRLTLPIVSAV